MPTRRAAAASASGARATRAALGPTGQACAARLRSAARSSAARSSRLAERRAHGSGAASGRLRCLRATRRIASTPSFGENGFRSSAGRFGSAARGGAEDTRRPRLASAEAHALVAARAALRGDAALRCRPPARAHVRSLADMRASAAQRIARSAIVGRAGAVLGRDSAIGHDQRRRSTRGRPGRFRRRRISLRPHKPSATAIVVPDPRLSHHDARTFRARRAKPAPVSATRSFELMEASAARVF